MRRKLTAPPAPLPVEQPPSVVPGSLAVLPVSWPVGSVVPVPGVELPEPEPEEAEPLPEPEPLGEGGVIGAWATGTIEM